MAVKTADVSGARREALPEDIYVVQIIDVEEKKGKDSGKTYYSISCEVCEGEYQGYELMGMVSPERTSKKTGKTTNTEDLLDICEACGIDVPDSGSFEYDPDDWIGNKVKVKIKNEEYEERERSKISRWLGGA